MADDRMHVIALDKLNTAMRMLVRGYGSSEAEVLAVADNLIAANLTGHDSHGIGMLPRYTESFLEGGLKPNAQVHVEHDGGTLLRLNGQRGFGQVIGAQAMALGIERARAQGSCIIALGNAHHLGRIGAWAEQVAAAGLISLHFVNVISRPIVAPHGGGDARFGTNPVCIGVPLAGRAPVILDFATSMIAQGKTRVALNKGEQVAEGCLIDDQGRPSTEPRFTVNPPYGALLTFGAHKGYGLALMAELLGGALGAGMTQREPDSGQKRVLNGMFSILLDAGQLADKSRFEAEALSFLDWVQACPAREGFDGVQVAGDAERAWRARRTASGVPVDATTWGEILAAAAKLGLDAAALNGLAGLA